MEINGYVINNERITHQRFKELEIDVNILKRKIDAIDNTESSKKLDLEQGIFYDGQIFDAYIFINDILKVANHNILLIDNYIDDSVLTLFSKYKHLKYIIITKSTSKQLKLDISKYNQQYNNLNIKISSNFHDRFLIIDNIKAYHIGASLKDLGKKIFAFNKIDINLLENELKG